MTLLDADTIDEYTAAGYWRAEPLAATIAEHARKSPASLAVLSEDDVMSWQEYDDRSISLRRSQSSVRRAGSTQRSYSRTDRAFASSSSK